MSALVKILLVDDDDSIRDFVSMALAEDGCEVAAVANGRAALSLIERFHPNVILLDMRMPTMDGWEFSRAYRQTPGSHAPIIVLTASRDAAANAADVAADGFLAKPFDLVDLLKIVDRYRSPDCPSSP